MPAGAPTADRTRSEHLTAWIHGLTDLEDAAARRDLFSSQPEALHPETAERLHAEVLRLAYVDLQRAGRLAEAAEWLAQELNHPSARAFSLRARGHVHFAKGQHGSALECYQSAIELLERLGSDLDAGRTFTSGLQALIYLGRYDQAFQWAERARAIFERHGDELRLARLASNVGNILYRQDRYAEALQHYEKAREPLSRLGEPRDLAAVLSNMAVCATSLGQFAEAVAHYGAARDHCVGHDLPLLVSAADYNIAYLHFLRGDYLQAMRLYHVSRERAEQTGDLYHAALCDLDESEMSLELNLSEEGARLAGEAAARFEQSGMSYERAKAMVNQATAASQAGDLGGALRLLRQARGLFEREQNRMWPALIDLYQAFLLYRRGNYRESQRLSRSAYRFLSGSQMADKAAHCRLLQAQLLRQEGRAEQARAACLEILRGLDPDITPSLRFQVQFVLGQVEEQLENWEGAWAAYQSARQEIEALRNRLPGDELKISVLKDKLAVYEALVWLALWRRPSGESTVREAFRFICQAKSRSLADHIAFPLETPRQNSGDVEQQIQEARRDLNWHYRQIERLTLEAGAGPPTQVERLRQQARQCEERLVRSLSAWRAKGADTALPDQPARVDIDAIRASIPRDAMLLEYYEVRGALYVCLLSHDQLRICPLAAAARVRNLYRLFQLQVSKFRLGSEYQRAFQRPMLEAALAHLKELHAELIAPVSGLLTAPHLIIAPHSFLHGLPFHALHGKGRFLVDEFRISYAPSARVFHLCCASAPNFSHESLVMGVPDAGAPHIEWEARYAAAALPNARLLLGREATEAALREYGPASRFLHIATHGLFRRDQPMFSAIQLGDSRLSLFDLYQLRLSAELVTLSGCSTGLNTVVGGDELLGLIRGLLYAGAQGVLASLWDVHDRSTAEFMTAFYGRLGLENKAEALRSGMLELRERYPHPYYWAPFILVGKYLS